MVNDTRFRDANNEPLNIGDRVWKRSGDYEWDGYIIATARKLSGRQLVLVEHKDNGAVHLFRPHQVSLIQ